MPEEKLYRVALREALGEEMERDDSVYLIGEDATTIAAALANVAPDVLGCGELDCAIATAAQAVASDPDATEQLVEGGPVVLLSPACASFDQFADFEARGERFRELVEKLQG